MLPDFTMIQHQFYGGHDITIVPIADVHLGAEEFMLDEFEEFINTVKETPNVYITLGGDLLNNGIKSSKSNVYRERFMPGESKRMMAKLLEPIRDRILCSVCGNHEQRTVRDVDSDPTLDIMAKLDLEHLYRENIAFVKINLGQKTSEDPIVRPRGESRPCYMVAVTHGSGGGALTGSGVNKYERFGYFIDGLDVLVVGHIHKPFTTQPGKIHIDPHNNKISIKPFKIVCATSWLEYGGYASRGMFAPSTHCLQSIRLFGDRKGVEVTM